MIRGNARLLLGRATGYAVATCVVALVVSAMLSGADAERFAATAYIAATFAALAMAARWLLPVVEPAERPRGTQPPFPTAFKFAVGVASLVACGAALVSEPGAVGIAIAALFALVGVAALVRAGVIAAAVAELASGGRLAAARRYAAVVGLLALVAAALLAPQNGESYARVGYLLAVIGAVTVAASLILASHERLRTKVVDIAQLLMTPASAAVFATTATYAAATAALALILAALLPGPDAERFATTGYIAVVFAAAALAAKWRIGAGDEPPVTARTTAGVLRFVEGVAVLTIAGATLTRSPVTQGIGVFACLWIIAYAIAVRAGAAAPIRAPRFAVEFVTGDPLRDVIRMAAGIAAFALSLTAVLPAAYAERSLYAAYLAAVVAAVTLGVKHFWHPGGATPRQS